jgi:hypothetical protein
MFGNEKVVLNWGRIVSGKSTSPQSNIVVFNFCKNLAKLIFHEKRQENFQYKVISTSLITP